MTSRITARRIDVRGVVQGVGFRPLVYRLALDHAIRGWVYNDAQGVTIHAEGASANVEAFMLEMERQAPFAAKILELRSEPAKFLGCEDFGIRASRPATMPTAKICPDLPVCPDCLNELYDPASRRFLYPYINCTACGPRYSIIRSLPYDRRRTTMSGWTLCPSCQVEYDDPLNRRHHAQPTACHHCGPNYELVVDHHSHRGSAAIEFSAALLRDGKIVAVKGIGGYHLACAARDEAAVMRLRERKFRKEKPFALMVPDLASALAIVRLDALQIELLHDVARPIVLAAAKEYFPAIAPDSDELGIMLAYAPLHEMLFHFDAPNPLVLTSANRSDEPIAYLDEDARERLQGLADAYLIGERPIARRVDDSVVAVRGQRRVMIRRSRGYAPGVVARVTGDQPLLAVGADLKNAIAIVVGGEVIVSQHIGDLGQLDTDCAFEQTVHDLLAMYDLKFSDLVVAHDLHPEYVSTRFAKSFQCHRRIPVQHHRAHLASVMAERGELDRTIVGVALDGTGWGDDASIWGFEVFAGSVVDGFRRVMHLPPVLLAGGDAAARNPVQSAAGFLVSADLPDMREPPFRFPKRFFQSQQLVAKKVRCFRTSSAGRLFDAVAALCGFTRQISFEGQAAIWLEHHAHAAMFCEPYPFPDFDHRPLMASIIRDRLAGRDVAEIAFAFHAAVAKSVWQVASKVATQYQVDACVLSGGVFQNRLLCALLEEHAIGSDGMKLLYNELVPSNDGGIALGQAALANAAYRPFGRCAS